MLSIDTDNKSYSNFILVSERADEYRESKKCSKPCCRGFIGLMLVISLLITCLGWINYGKDNGVAFHSDMMSVSNSTQVGKCADAFCYKAWNDRSTCYFGSNIKVHFVNGTSDERVYHHGTTIYWACTLHWQYKYMELLALAVFGSIMFLCNIFCVYVNEKHGCVCK